MAEKDDHDHGYELAPGVWRFGDTVHVSLHDLADQYGLDHDPSTYALLAHRVVEMLVVPAAEEHER